MCMVYLFFLKVATYKKCYKIHINTYAHICVVFKTSLNSFFFFLIPKYRFPGSCIDSRVACIPLTQFPPLVTA